MLFIVLFIAFSGLTLALIIHENVAFHKVNEIALPYYNNMLSCLVNDDKYFNYSVESFISISSSNTVLCSQ